MTQRDQANQTEWPTDKSTHSLETQSEGQHY